MTLAVPRQSQRAQEAVDLALFLTNADQQARFAAEARVLPSSLEALSRVRAELEQQVPSTAEERQIRQARLLSASTLERARVLVPALPGIKRLQKIIYTQMQRAMLAQVSPEQALTAAASNGTVTPVRAGLRSPAILKTIGKQAARQGVCVGVQALTSKVAAR